MSCQGKAKITKNDSTEDDGKQHEISVVEKVLDIRDLSYATIEFLDARSWVALMLTSKLGRKRSASIGENEIMWKKDYFLLGILEVGQQTRAHIMQGLRNEDIFFIVTENDEPSIFGTSASLWELFHNQLELVTHDQDLDGILTRNCILYDHTDYLSECVSEDLANNTLQHNITRCNYYVYFSDDAECREWHGYLEYKKGFLQCAGLGCSAVSLKYMRFCLGCIKEMPEAWLEVTIALMEGAGLGVAINVAPDLSDEVWFSSDCAQICDIDGLVKTRKEILECIENEGLVRKHDDCDVFPLMSTWLYDRVMDEHQFAVFAIQGFECTVAHFLNPQASKWFAKYDRCRQPPCS